MDGAGETHRGREADEKNHHTNASAPRHRRDVIPGGGGAGPRASWVVFAPGRAPAVVPTAGLQAAL